MDQPRRTRHNSAEESLEEGGRENLIVRIKEDYRGGTTTTYALGCDPK